MTGRRTSEPYATCERCRQMFPPSALHPCGPGGRYRYCGRCVNEAHRPSNQCTLANIERLLTVAYDGFDDFEEPHEEPSKPFAALADALQLVTQMLAQQRADETSEQSSDGPCQDLDGCPTELAVLKRFWREKHALIPPEGPMPSGCTHQWKYFETVETLKGGCGFERCEHCGTERVAKSRRSEKATASPDPREALNPIDVEQQ